MKVLFVYRFANYEPLGIMTLSAVLKAAGHQCQYLDLKLEKDPVDLVRRLRPDVIAYSLITGSHQLYRDFNLTLKKQFSFISFFGGPHCTYFPDFISEEGVDIICRGEGEQAMLEFAAAFDEKKDYSNIQNLWVKQGDLIIKNEIRNLITDLDSLPFPDRELVNVYAAYRKMKRRDVIASRGCPYQCTYCFNNANLQLYRDKGPLVRQRSVDHMIAELQHLQKTYGASKFHFQDDVFTVQKKWVLEFAEKAVKVPNMAYEVQLRVNMAGREIVDALKRSGCTLIMYGIESGNETLRRNVLNRNISDEEILQAASLFREYKIRTMSVNMVGLPDETLDMVHETINLNIRCKPSYAWNAIYQPYPMTRLSEICREKGYFDGNFDSFRGTFLYGKSLLKMPDIRRIERLHYLFPLCVSMPVFKGLLLFLTRWPLNGLYRLWFFVDRAWAALFSLRRISFAEMLVWEKRKYFRCSRSW